MHSTYHRSIVSYNDDDARQRRYRRRRIFFRHAIMPLISTISMVRLSLLARAFRASWDIIIFWCSMLPIRHRQSRAAFAKSWFFMYARLWYRCYHRVEAATTAVLPPHARRLPSPPPARASAARHTPQQYHLRQRGLALLRIRTYSPHFAFRSYIRHHFLS